jgi:hypothetical protein
MIIRSLGELGSKALLKIKGLTSRPSLSFRISRVWLSKSTSSMGL